MGFKDVIKKSVLEGFSGSDISLTKVIILLGICFLLSVYIFMVYKYVTKNTFYDGNFNVSMSIISVVVAGIILAMQSNIVISLGMVGALSIVRFRTAIKEPMDLLFLFWSIGNGIMCGAGLCELSVAVSLVVTMGILVLQTVPMRKSPYLVIINADNKEVEGEILEVIRKYSSKYRLDSKNIRRGGMDMIIEIRCKEGNRIVDELSEIKGVLSASLMYHDGEVKSSL